MKTNKHLKKIEASDLQSIYKESNFDQKKRKALDLCNSMNFKNGSLVSIIKKIESCTPALQSNMKYNIDFLVSQLLFVQEGSKVIK